LSGKSAGAVRKLVARREVSLILVLALLVGVITARSPGFLAGDNILSILDDTAILFMVGTGQLMAIIIGGIDLSVASGIALSGMASAMVSRAFPAVPMGVIVLLALAIGFILGSFNGLLVSVARIPPIITTLGTLSIYRGFVVVLSGGSSVVAYQMSRAFQALPRREFLGIHSLLWFAVITVAFFAVFLRSTRTGREIYGYGGNHLAAEYAGISARKIQYLVFMLSGLIVGFAGLLWVARYASAQADTASGFELQTVAACVVGGVSISGGSGTVWGVALGSLFLGIVSNALTQVRISPFWQQAIQGFVILLAIVINTLTDRRTQRLSARRILPS
jgi:rhamnose transport system permease protein